MTDLTVIAEIGENHIGDMAIARALIEKAALAGADYAKFQSYRPELFKADDPEYEWFKKVSLSNEDHVMLKHHAESCGIKFLSSPFSLERAKFLCEDLNMKDIKIASAVMLNFPIIDYVNKKAKLVFLSTGMATIAEIKKAVERLKGVPELYILHCVSQYPCRDEDANLAALSHIRKNFPGYRVGYSDHTIGTHACLAAVALGAEIIEKHFTFDKDAREGTDHAISVTCEELKDLIRDSRRVRTLLGKGIKEPASGEAKIVNMLRGKFVG